MKIIKLIFCGRNGFTQMLSWPLTSINNLFPSSSPLYAWIAPITGKSLPPLTDNSIFGKCSALLCTELKGAFISLTSRVKSTVFIYSPTQEPLSYLERVSGPHVTSFPQAEHHQLIYPLRLEFSLTSSRKPSPVCLPSLPRDPRVLCA